MEKTAALNIRVNPETKRKAEDILSILGIPMSTAIDMYLKQISLTGGIPFQVKVPNPPKEVNMDHMTSKELEEKLNRGYQDAISGNITDAKTFFDKFQKDYFA